MAATDVPVCDKLGAVVEVCSSAFEGPHESTTPKEIAISHIDMSRSHCTYAQIEYRTYYERTRTLLVANLRNCCVPDIKGAWVEAQPLEPQRDRFDVHLCDIDSSDCDHSRNAHKDE